MPSNRSKSPPPAAAGSGGAASSAADALTPKNAHDAAFSFVFGDPAHAAGLLRGALPEGVAAQLDWTTLKREPGSFVDAKLKWRHSDVLFSVHEPADGEGWWLYVLIEHQSRPDRFMALRLLRYMLRAWDEHLRGNKRARTLPIIFPLILYAGRRSWRAPRTFRDLLSGVERLPPAAQRHLPQLDPLFLDLRAKDAATRLDQCLSAYGRLMVWAMRKAGDDKGLLADLRGFADVLADLLRQKDAEPALEVFWRYLFATHARMDAAGVGRFVVEEVEPLAGGHTMTVYDRLIEKGRKAGREEGREEGREVGRGEGHIEGLAALLLRQLAFKFGDVPPTIAGRVRAANRAELTRWGELVLTAQRLSEMFPADDAPAAGPRRAKRNRPSQRRAPSIA